MTYVTKIDISAERICGVELLVFVAHHSAAVTCDLQILLACYDTYSGRAVCGRDGRRVRLVLLCVQSNPKRDEPLAHPLAHDGAMLADAAGKDEHVEAA